MSIQERLEKAAKSTKSISIQEEMIPFHNWEIGVEIIAIPVGTHSIPDTRNPGLRRDVLKVETEGGLRLIGTSLIMTAYERDQLKIDQVYKISYLGKAKSVSNGNEYNNFEILHVLED
jgi:hypothetical protein